MKKSKKITAVLITAALTFATAFTAFAHPGRHRGQNRDNSDSRPLTCTQESPCSEWYHQEHQGHHGNGQGLGAGGMRLHDGSCYSSY